MLTENALKGFRDYAKRTISYARYKIGNSYFNAKITDITTDVEGKLKVDFTIDPTAHGDITVTEVQLYNTSGELWWNKSENITRKSNQEGIFYRVTINIHEE